MNKKAILGICALAMILFVGSVVYYYQNSWKTYTSEKYSYSISYPATWKLEEIYDGRGINLASPTDQKLLKSSSSLSIQEKLHIFNVQVVPHAGTSTYPYEKRETALVGGKPVEKITSYGPDFTSVDIRVIKGDTLYLLSFPEDDVSEKIFESFTVDLHYK